jgi:hypothetical protein
MLSWCMPARNPPALLYCGWVRNDVPPYSGPQTSAPYTASSRPAVSVYRFSCRSSTDRPRLFDGPLAIPDSIGGGITAAAGISSTPTSKRWCKIPTAFGARERKGDASG